jgi:hypothetical protein
MKLVCDAYAEVGPGLLFDRDLLTRLSTASLRDLVLHRGFVPAAEQGQCCFIETEGVRQFTGKVEVYVDEPAPDSARYARLSRLGLWLRAPSGRLVLHGAGSLDPERRDSAPPLLEVEVPPGHCSVDLYAYTPHALRLEEEGFPGEPPPSRWTSVFHFSGCLLAVFTAASLVGAGVLAWRGAWGAVPRPLLLCAALWVPWMLLYRLSGESARERKRDVALRQALAGLPPIPNYVLVLRSGFVPTDAARGGGLRG